jgi:2-polyprenyl-6-methoxyphenol hydroxylase-like FAD-dependent oxidoreductase
VIRSRNSAAQSKSVGAGSLLLANVATNLVKRADVESIYPTWVLNELPHWGSNGIVLIGDAAHAMDPTTGQGASQALEDSLTLSLLLKEVLQPNATHTVQGTEKEKVDLAIKLFHDIRKPRVQEIVERGKKIAGRKENVGVVAEYFMYFFLWMMNRFPAIGEIWCFLGLDLGS